MATSSPGAQTPKTPQASWGPFSPGSRSWLSRPSPRGTLPSVGEIDHWSELGTAGKCHSTEGDGMPSSRYSDALVDCYKSIRTRSRPAQPLGDRSVTPLGRRHAGPARVVSVIRRCRAQPQLLHALSHFSSARPAPAAPRAVPRLAGSRRAGRGLKYLCLRTRGNCPGVPSRGRERARRRLPGLLPDGRAGRGERAFRTAHGRCARRPHTLFVRSAGPWRKRPGGGAAGGPGVGERGTPPPPAPLPGRAVP